LKTIFNSAIALIAICKVIIINYQKFIINSQQKVTCSELILNAVFLRGDFSRVYRPIVSHLLNCIGILLSKISAIAVDGR